MEAQQRVAARARDEAWRFSIQILGVSNLVGNIWDFFTIENGMINDGG